MVDKTRAGGGGTREGRLPGCGEANQPRAAATKLLSEAPGVRQLGARDSQLRSKQLVAAELPLLQLPHLESAALLPALDGDHQGVRAVAQQEFDAGDADRVHAVLVRDGDAGVGDHTQVQVSLLRGSGGRN